MRPAIRFWLLVAAIFAGLIANVLSGSKLAGNPIDHTNQVSSGSQPVRPAARLRPEATCTTDTDCMLKHGGNGDPEPR